MSKQETTPRCSFCGKTEAEVRKLITRINKDFVRYKLSPKTNGLQRPPTRVRICDECVEVCNQFMVGYEKAIENPGHS